MSTQLYVFAGQSNAQRWGNANSLPNAIAAAGADVAFVNAGLGGSGTWADPDDPDWYPTQDGQSNTGELLAAMFAQINAHLGDNPDTAFHTIIWAQGEKETRPRGQQGDYLERLEDIYSLFRAEYGPDFRFVYVPLTAYAPVFLDPSLGFLPSWAQVQTIQSVFTMMHPEIQVLDPVAVAAGAGLATQDIYRDALHYSYPMLDALSDAVLLDWTPPPVFPDALKGSAQADTLWGSIEDDVIFGNRGADVVTGGRGHDTVFGGGQNDVLSGNKGDDVLLGQKGDDQLTGGAGNDALFGGAGHDTLTGNKGADSLFAGAGDNVLSGGNNSDALYGGAGADTLDGGRGNDLLSGGNGDDVLNGGLGNDSLFGGLGQNTLTGGAGADVFQYHHAGAQGIDHIADFETGLDAISVLEGQGLSVVLTPQGNENRTLLEIGDITIYIENGAMITSDDVLFL